MKRTIEQIKEHYKIEKELAIRLKQSSKEERKYLYTSLYDELYRRVPLHPQLTRKIEFSERNKQVTNQIAFLKRFLNKNIIFAEIGPGDCALSFAICKNVKKVYAIDVSEIVTNNKQSPANFQLIISDGTSIPLPSESVNIFYSNQLIEHLHPDDAIEQLTNVYYALTNGGRYVCVTPNRINGPHDVSSYFDKEATGFHLKEYTFLDLKKIFKKIGFTTIKGYLGAKGIYLKTPIFLILMIEWLLNLLPFSIKRYDIFKPFLNIRIIGIK